MRNPLTFVSDRTRLTIYAVVATVTLIIGAIQVGYASLEAPNPDWLTVALAVVPFLAAGIGYTAATHTGHSDTGATPGRVAGPEH